MNSTWSKSNKQREKPYNWSLMMKRGKSRPLKMKRKSLKNSVKSRLRSKRSSVWNWWKKNNRGAMPSKSSCSTSKRRSALNNKKYQACKPNKSRRLSTLKLKLRSCSLNSSKARRNYNTMLRTHRTKSLPTRSSKASRPLSKASKNCWAGLRNKSWTWQR